MAYSKPACGSPASSAAMAAVALVSTRPAPSAPNSRCFIASLRAPATLAQSRLERKSETLSNLTPVKLPRVRRSPARSRRGIRRSGSRRRARRRSGRQAGSAPRGQARWRETIALKIRSSATPKGSTSQAIMKVSHRAMPASPARRAPDRADSPSLRAGGSAAMSRTALKRLAAPAPISAAITALGSAISAMAVRAHGKRQHERDDAIGADLVIAHDGEASALACRRRGRRRNRQGRPRAWRRWRGSWRRARRARRAPAGRRETWASQ